MAVRAADQVTLQILPAPSYVRQFYLLQSSTLNPPAKPTTNPPAAPWSTTEPSYTGGSTDTLYTVWLTAYGSVAFEYGDVQKSTSFEAAKAAWNKANAAQETASTAYDRADNALTMAGTKSKVLYSTAPASGTATVNDVWRRLPTAAEITAGASAGDIMQEWRYTASGWQETKISTTAIANLDVGKLTVGTGVISDLVAQSLAARTGVFMKLGVDQLTAADAAISQAVIEKLWADVVKAKFLTVTEKIIANDIFAAGVIGANALATDALDFKTAKGMTLTAATLTGSTVRTAANGQRVQLDTTGLRTFNASNVQTSLLSATSGGMRLTGSFEISKDLNPGTPWALITDSGFSVSEAVGGNGAHGILRPTNLVINTSMLPESPNYTRGGVTVRGGGPNGGGSPGVSVNATGGSSLNLSAGKKSSLGNQLSQIASDGDLQIAAGGFADSRIVLASPRLYIDSDTVGRKGDIPWKAWSSGQWGTYGTGWSNLIVDPYDGVQATVKEGVFYLTIAMQKSSGHVGSEVILRLRTEYRPPAPMMQFAWASGANFVVAQPNGDVIVAVARAGAGNLTASLLSWPLN